jgi:hypothetical protein
MNGDQPDTDESKQIEVQFNPATLRVTLSNTLKAENRGGGSGAPAQFVEKSESSLAVELVFDTSVERPGVAANSDVRRLTQRVADTFMKPEDPESDRPGAPKRCRFQWGSFQFTGMLSSYNETLDFFAPEGIPLRATLALNFKEDRYQFDLDERVTAGARDTPTFAPAGEGITVDKAAQDAGRDPKGWRDVALFNGIENPRFTLSAGISLPAPGIKLSATAGIGVLATAPTVSVGAGLSASVGVSAGAGVSVGAGASAGASVSVGAPSVSVGIGRR